MLSAIHIYEEFIKDSYEIANSNVKKRFINPGAWFFGNELLSESGIVRNGE